ncbi:hypothetical protein Acr_00g0071030 [Actinidia rufa]|uniref:DUF659 domain-containing protein n=1 Tax=Actinidia rufa TaxID=165716 RepID=A0A7J0DTJ0_9ERIC|nr:hypothetical protein Acr_00g0071030 [Actinidia rufa]
MSSFQSLRPSVALGAKFDNKSLWNHVKGVAIADGGGENRTWNCNYYNKKVVGSYTKVKGHLLRLTHHNVEERDVADKEAARMFYASGLPFNFARSPYFRKYSLTLANNRSGWLIIVPPSFDRLHTTLLAQEKEHINRLLQPIKDTWKKKGVSMVSDGWSDRQRRPLINIMAASSRRSMFLKAIDASENIKDVEYVANLFIQVIKDLGEANVVQIVTDNASVN